MKQNLNKRTLRNTVIVKNHLLRQSMLERKGDSGT